MVNLDQIPTDAGLQIMRFLTHEEMNVVAEVSSRLRDIRNDPAVDQTRTGTVRILREMNVREFFDKFARWNSIFQGNKSRLRIGRS